MWCVGAVRACSRRSAHAQAHRMGRSLEPVGLHERQGARSLSAHRELIAAGYG